MARLITDKDTNVVYFSEWIKELPSFENIKEALVKYQTDYGLLPHTKDYWARDYMPIQIFDNKFVRYRYNPDYLQNKKAYITDPADCCRYIGIETIESDLIIDGGNVIKCHDCIVMTDKIFAENPSCKKTDLISRLETLFNAEIVFIPWDKCDKYGHADGMIRYIEGSKVLLNNYIDFDKPLRKRIIDALNNRFDIVELHYDTPHRSSSGWAYINYLQVGKLILLPSLGIDEDNQAYTQFKEIFKDCDIEPVNVSGIVKMGGALNCISWNIKHG